MEFGWELDPKLIDDGEWKPYDRFLKGFRIKLRSTRSKEFAVLLERKNAAVRAQNLKKRARKEAFSRAFQEAIAESIIVAWDGLHDKDGAAVAYSEDFALELMTDSKHTLLADQIVQDAMTVGVPQLPDTDDEDEEEDSLGN